MIYPVTLEGFEDQTIELEAPGLFATPKLLVNGKPAPKGPGFSQITLQRSDGTSVIATWKPQMMGFDVPQLSVEGKTIIVVKPLAWYEWGWCLVTLSLLLGYGMVGAGLVVVAFFFDLKIFRSTLHPVLKYLAAAGLSGLLIGAYALLAIIYTAFINR
jgi:hypothetical protein